MARVAGAGPKFDLIVIKFHLLRPNSRRLPSGLNLLDDDDHPVPQGRDVRRITVIERDDARAGRDRYGVRAFIELPATLKITRLASGYSCPGAPPPPRVARQTFLNRAKSAGLDDAPRGRLHQRAASDRSKTDLPRKLAPPRCALAFRPKREPFHAGVKHGSKTPKGVEARRGNFALADVANGRARETRRVAARAFAFAGRGEALADPSEQGEQIVETWALGMDIYIPRENNLRAHILAWYARINITCAGWRALRSKAAILVISSPLNGALTRGHKTPFRTIPRPDVFSSR